MRYWLLSAAVLSALIFWITAPPSIEASHIDAHVPDKAEFDTLLQRDLLVYFRANGSSNASSLVVRLLRDSPTQSGVAYPKYFAWVQVSNGGILIAEGAVRVAAFDRIRFEVTNFVSKQQAKGNPELLRSVFPQALVPNILSLAAK